MQPLDFRIHMFRHAFIYQLKGSGGLPVAIAKCITGHGRNAYKLTHYV